MRGEEVILLNFPISHFLKSLAHSAMIVGWHDYENTGNLIVL